MRQKEQSKEDDKLRKALENMRYKDCTVEDLQFLRTWITSQLPGKPTITSPAFRYVSIITAKNSQKDEINHLGCQKFAQETGQELVHFFSDDVLKSAEDTHQLQKGRNKVTKLTERLQSMLWQLPHSSANKPVPGKLSLCFGLPVMIKCNVATELCITNGQEGTVIGWQSSLGKKNQRILDVLFVKLKSPPKNVQIESLPLNVVPLTCSTVSISCNLPDGSKVSISRSQVEVLPNFAMTDFASQGKTRAYNIVDLNNCRSHQAYYTALSCSSTAEGTIILQGFEPKKITGKASGALRQEFRELELLDEVTNLRFNGNLPQSVQGDRRNVLIHTFRQYKGSSYIPSSVHSSIKWSQNDPMLEPIADDMPWIMIGKPAKTIAKQPAKTYNEPEAINGVSNSPDATLKNMKRKEITPNEEHQSKIRKTQHFISTSTEEHLIDIDSLAPSGTTWYQNSCPYDAILCIVHTIWNNNKDQYTQLFNATNNEILYHLALNWQKHSYGIKTLESARDDMRRFLHQLAPSSFRWAQFTSVSHIIMYMFTFPVNTMVFKYRCTNNHVTQSRTPDNTCLIYAGSTRYASISEWMSTMSEETNKNCITCNEKLTNIKEFAFPLPFIALDFSGQTIQIDVTFIVPINNAEISYRLCGIIYFGNSHFTSRVIYDNGMVWFHDGIETGQKLIYEGILNGCISLNQCNGKEAIVAIYIKH